MCSPTSTRPSPRRQMPEKRRPSFLKEQQGVPFGTAEVAERSPAVAARPRRPSRAFGRGGAASGARHRTPRGRSGSDAADRNAGDARDGACDDRASAFRRDRPRRARTGGRTSGARPRPRETGAIAPRRPLPRGGHTRATTPGSSPRGEGRRGGSRDGETSTPAVSGHPPCRAGEPAGRTCSARPSRERWSPSTSRW
jgi:hypothetical protein